MIGLEVGPQLIAGGLFFGIQAILGHTLKNVRHCIIVYNISAILYKPKNKHISQRIILII